MIKLLLWKINLNIHFQSSNFPKTEQSSNFEINGRQFCWMSLAELERDQTIMEKNSDIVSFVKRLVG